jgi:RNA polymerase sigma-70 factor (ECF subfamily)
MMRHDEQDLADAARVVAGDTSAFEGIVERWQLRLFNLAWRFCRNRATAEDMAQEVFIRVFRSLATFRGQSAFSTWITAIAVNTYRSRIRTLGQPTLGLEPTRTAAAEGNPLERLQERERNEVVQRAVLTLPERYRDAIVLFYFEEKDLAETARVLNVSEGTLKARLHRGRDLLRRRCSSLREFAPASNDAPMFMENS